jgi:hypothetical protein
MKRVTAMFKLNSQYRWVVLKDESVKIIVEGDDAVIKLEQKNQHRQINRIE